MAEPLERIRFVERGPRTVAARGTLSLTDGRVDRGPIKLLNLEFLDWELEDMGFGNYTLHATEASFTSSKKLHVREVKFAYPTAPPREELELLAEYFFTEEHPPVEWLPGGVAPYMVHHFRYSERLPAVIREFGHLTPRVLDALLVASRLWRVHEDLLAEVRLLAGYRTMLRETAVTEENDHLLMGYLRLMRAVEEDKHPFALELLRKSMEWEAHPVLFFEDSELFTQAVATPPLRALFMRLSPEDYTHLKQVHVTHRATVLVAALTQDRLKAHTPTRFFSLKPLRVSPLPRSTRRSRVEHFTYGLDSRAFGATFTSLQELPEFLAQASSVYGFSRVVALCELWEDYGLNPAYSGDPLRHSLSFVSLLASEAPLDKPLSWLLPLHGVLTEELFGRPAFLPAL